MTLEDVKGRRLAAYWARQGRLLAEREAELDCGEKVVRPAGFELVDLDGLATVEECLHSETPTAY